MLQKLKIRHMDGCPCDTAPITNRPTPAEGLPSPRCHQAGSMAGGHSSLRDNLYRDGLEALWRIAAFVRATGVPVLAIDKEMKDLKIEELSGNRKCDSFCLSFSFSSSLAAYLRMWVTNDSSQTKGNSEKETSVFL